ncbi:FG-GAP repeat protein [Rubinisphaera italica]|uniref:FG-GAP repeat protein n=1 Tax=Rubinisphaera italica TaxID=2527969 RepID=A0A5C5XC16_9PLAN|nr:FG-GAP repeat protein [Rubinisphaera italica]
MIVLLLLAVAIPLLAWKVIPSLPSIRTAPEVYSGGTSYPISRQSFNRLDLDPEIRGLPLITNVQIVDVDSDGQQDILVCDAQRNAVSYFKKAGENWTEVQLVRDIPAPAHATLVDIDQDGDQDLIVSVLGDILPDDNVVGRVELYENRPEGFQRHVILDEVRRVADVQPGDFDGDGDIDLAVAVFGYDRGCVLWLENLGEMQFLDHELLNAPGTIHVPVADFDNDGDLDITAIVSQDEEELWGFENLGDGNFNKRRIWMTINFDLGSAGLIAADLDGDGDQDLIMPAGDNLEDLDAYPQPYHGCYWFENRGEWDFQMARIADLGGTYSAAVGDVDNDGDQDIALVSMTNNWSRTDTASVVWLENDGHQQFTTWQIASDPIHLVTVAIGDLNDDGQLDIVAGGLNLRKPYQRLGRISAWINQGKN